MKLNKKKKGFTIVELVIVIGVIGILTAVLVPTFINLTAKANNAADESLVKTLNTQLALKRVEEGKNVTMSGALADALEAGYKVENLTPKGNRDIVWNQDSDEFSLLEAVPDTDAYKYWTVAKSDADLAKGYSVFMNYQHQGALDVKVGVDVGSYPVSVINYAKGDTAKKDVRMLTDGGTLTIDADTDVVKHYEYIDKLVIKAIYGESYHEFGRVGVSMEVQDGHVVVEDKGYVEELLIPETEEGKAVSVAINNGGTVNTAVIDDTEATVEVAAQATVSQVVGETANISGAGAEEAKENAVVKTYVYNESGEGKLTLQEALRSEDKPTYIVFAEDITVSAWDASDQVGASITWSLTIDGNGHTLTGDKKVTRGIWIDESYVDVTIKNLTVTGSKIQRAIQVNGDIDGCSLTIDNVTATASYYTVNVCNNVDDLELTITDSTLNGWGALNLWGNSYSVLVSNSTLVGHNDKGYNADGWNDFGTIVLEGDTTERTDEHSSDIDVKLVGSTIKATTSNQGNEQCCVLFNNQSAHNNVYADGCTFVYDNDHTFLMWYFNETNRLYINGVMQRE